MGKREKFKKDILKTFEDFTEEELLTLIYDVVNVYTKVTKAEKRASEILEKYGFITYLGDKNKTIKRNYLIMLECANIRNLVIPRAWYEVEPSKEDIIEIIQYIRYQITSKIEEDDYSFGDYYEDSEESTFKKPSEKQIEKINLFFERILSEEFNLTKEDDYKLFSESAKRIYDDNVRNFNVLRRYRKQGK